MTQDTSAAAQGCLFCAIVTRQAEASVVYEDESVVAFMSLHPVTPGHLLVVPRKHAVGLEDLDAATSAHVWSVGHDMARALRRSAVRCEGINVLLCDGGVAFQTVFHLHLHVIPAGPKTGGPSSPTRRHARGRSSTATREPSGTPSGRGADRSPPLVPSSEPRQSQPINAPRRPSSTETLPGPDQARSPTPAAPRGYSTLAVKVVTAGQDGAVSAQPERVHGTGCDVDDVLPARDVALASTHPDRQGPAATVPLPTNQDAVDVATLRWHQPRSAPASPPPSRHTHLDDEGLSN